MTITPQEVQLPNILLILLFPLLLLFLSRRRCPTGGIHPPPPVPGLPFLGNLHQVMGTLPHRSLRDLARRHGPVMLLRLGTVPALVVSSAEAAKEVLRTHDADCCSRPDMPGPRQISYGYKDVSFSPYSEHWRGRRKLLVVEFLTKRRIQASWYARVAEVDKLMDRLTSAERKPVSMDDHIFECMDAVTGTVAFGNTYGTEQLAHRKRFREVVEDAMVMRSSFSAEDYFPNALGRFVDRLTGVAAFRETVFREFDAFFELVIEKHLHPSHVNDGGLIDTLIGHMKDQRQEGSTLDISRDHIKAILTNTYVGGVDTGSVTVVWALTELIRKPRVLKKVQDEIRTVVEQQNHERVHPDDLPKLKYLKMVVTETLRLHPTFPLLVPRETMRHVRISGFDVPAKTRIYVNAWAIGRDPANWDSPDEFDPGRFEGDVINFLDGTRFELLPFGAGRRMCPGMAMGLASVEFTLANLLYCFDWELPDGVGSEDVGVEEAGGLTVHKKTPLMLVPVRYSGRN